jgi:serine/threonine-protein kinase
MPDSLIGKKVGPYEIIAHLGHGGMADVYRAAQPSMRREVAVKILSDRLSNDAAFIERFRREVEITAQLEHAYIVPVYEHGITPEGQAYLSMRYLKGGTLAELIQKQGALPLDRVNTLFQQVAAAIDYAHKRGVTHRDIKPSNILLDDDQNGYLSDFGLARSVERSGQTLTGTGTMIGTPTYTSPEQIQDGRADHRSDIYSLGVVLYEMVTGRPPFIGDSVFTIMQAHLNKPPLRPSELRLDLPAEIERIILKALEKNPDRRYQTVSAMASDLNFAIANQGLTPVSVRLIPRTSSLTRVVPIQTNIRLLGVVVLVGAVLLVALVGLPRLMIAPEPTPAPPTPTVAVAARPFAPESERPANGGVEAVQVTAEEIAAAQAYFRGSFIGAMACSLKTDFHASFMRAIRTRAAEYGLSIEVEDAREAIDRQAPIVNSFIARGAKAIVGCVLDHEAVSVAVKAATDAGVIVATTGDRGFGAGSVLLSLTNETMGAEVGRYAAQYINENMKGEAVIAILDYPALAQVVIRADMMEVMIKRLAPKALIVGRWPGGLPDNGEASMAEILKTHPDVNVILSINDAGAIGAVRTLRAAKIPPDQIRIFSVDAETAARQLIEDGQYFVASLDNDPVGAGRLLIDAVVKMSAGRPVPRTVLLTGQMITREVLQATPAPSPTP